MGKIIKELQKRVDTLRTDVLEQLTSRPIELLIEIEEASTEIFINILQDFVKSNSDLGLNKTHIDYFLKTSEYLDLDFTAGWVCTDPDNAQFVRYHSDDNVYTFREFDRFGFSELYRELIENKLTDDLWKNEDFWIQNTIDFREFKTKEILEFCSGYYETEKVIEWMKKGENKSIICECIFEQSNELY